MTLLVIFGLGSILMVVFLTVLSLFAKNTGGQSPRSSLIEVWFNILIGFSINFGANLLIFPLVGAHVSPLQNFWMGWIFTCISLVRQYTIRRWFNAHIHLLSSKLAREG